MGPGNDGFFPIHVFPIFGLTILVLYSTPDLSKSGSAEIHMTRLANNRRHSVVI